MEASGGTGDDWGDAEEEEEGEAGQALFARHAPATKGIPRGAAAAAPSSSSSSLAFKCPKCFAPLSARRMESLAAVAARLAAAVTEQTRLTGLTAVLRSLEGVRLPSNNPRDHIRAKASRAAPPPLPPLTSQPPVLHSLSRSPPLPSSNGSKCPSTGRQGAQGARQAAAVRAAARGVGAARGVRSVCLRPVGPCWRWHSMMGTGVAGTAGRRLQAEGAGVAPLLRAWEGSLLWAAAGSLLRRSCLRTSGAAQLRERPARP